MRPLFRFRLFGIPVDVQLWFLVMAAMFASARRDPAQMLVGAVVIAASIVWHELGHALAFRAFGYPPRIVLVGMGGLTFPPEGADLSAHEDLLVSAAGPAAGLALGGAIWLLKQYGPSVAPFTPDGRLSLLWLAMSDAIWVNVWWSLFNLLPLIPLDGSHVADSATRWVNGRRKPRWVGFASMLVGAGGILYALSRQSLWLGFLGGMGAIAGWQRAGAGGLFSGRGGQETSPAAAARHTARLARSRGDLVGVAAALLPLARVGALPEPDLADLVGVLVRTGREAELVDLVRGRLTGFARGADAAPLAQLAAEGLSAAGAHEEALAVAKLGFEELHVPQHAYDAAVHLVALQRPEEAMEWLHKAAAAGLSCGPTMLSDPSLEPLRTRHDFLELSTGARPGAA